MHAFAVSSRKSAIETLTHKIILKRASATADSNFVFVKIVFNADDFRPIHLDFAAYRHFYSFDYHVFYHSFPFIA